MFSLTRKYSKNLANLQLTSELPVVFSENLYALSVNDTSSKQDFSVF